MSDIHLGHSRALCRRFDVPYLGHARLPYAALQATGEGMQASSKGVQASSEGIHARIHRARKTRIAYVAAVWGHVDSEALGFNA